jgi:hypothetical protein
MRHLLTGLFIFFSSLAFSQGAWDRWVTTTGTNTYLASIAVPTFPSSYNNTVLRLKFPNGNTGASTINVNGVGAIPIRKWDGDSWEPLVSGDLPANSSAILYYDNTNGYYSAIVFESIGGSGSTPTLQEVLTAGSALTGNNTISGGGILSFESTNGANYKADASLGMALDAFGAMDLQYGSLKLNGDPGVSGQFIGLSGWANVTGAQVTNTPAGTISATTAQAAINELDTEKASLASPTFTGTVGLPAGTVLTTPVINGLATGTGVASAATASTIAARDASGNLSQVNSLSGYTTTATAAGTTTLTVASNYHQYFTGTTTQTVVLPVTSTLALGHSFRIINNSTGIVTVQSSGANTIQAMAAGSVMTVTCILTSGTTDASWSFNYIVSNPMTTAGDIIIGGTPVGSVAPPVRLAAGTANYVLTSNGPGAAPSWAIAGGISGLTATRIPVATSSTVLSDYNGLKWDDATRTMTVGYTSSGNNILNLGSAGTGLNLNTSTGEYRFGAISSHFPTWYSNNAEGMRMPATRNLLVGSTTDNAKLYVVQGVLTSAWLPTARFTPGAHTGMTTATEFPNYVFDNATQTQASGTTATQRNFYVKRITYAGTSATRTITNAYGLYAEDAAAGTNGAITNNYALGTDGNIALVTAGNGIYIKEGSNATMGVATLSAGTVTVSTTKVTASSRIHLTAQSLGTVVLPAALGVTARSPGTSFTITSADVTDTSVVAWWIAEPTP